MSSDVSERAAGHRGQVPVILVETQMEAGPPHSPGVRVLSGTGGDAMKDRLSAEDYNGLHMRCGRACATARSGNARGKQGKSWICMLGTRGGVADSFA